MSDHILELIGAYLDGELHGTQLQKVEAHLEQCQICAEEYQTLQALSITLQDAPMPDFPASNRFAAEVALRLPRKSLKPASRSALELGWWMAPVGLLLAWIFVSTTILVSNLITTANGLGLLSSASAWLASGSGAEAYWSATLGQIGLLAGESLQWAEAAEDFARTVLSPITWQVSIAMLYLSWMAIWWARHTRQELGRFR